jgi:DNA modification methylase
VGNQREGAAVTARILTGDAIESLKTLEPESVQMACTSPPYFGLRDYGVDGQIGLEKTPAEYVDQLVAVFREVRRVLRDDGTVWLNLGDSYAGSWGAQGRADDGTKAGRSVVSASQIDAHPRFDRLTGTRGLGGGIKPKDLFGIPWRVAFALQSDGWYLRQDIIWHKPNPMPESVKDRCTKAHEYIFLLSKSERYFYDADAIAEESKGRELFGNSRSKGYCEQRQDNERRDMTPTTERNRRSVWTITSEPYPEAHFATFPTELPRLCILAGSKTGDTILDPFNGSGTTGQVALELGRHYVGCELNPKYVELTHKRLSRVTLGLPLEAA